MLRYLKRLKHLKRLKCLKRLKQLIKNEKGLSTLEAVVVAPLVVGLFFTTIQVGVAIFYRHHLNEIAYEATREVITSHDIEKAKQKVTSDIQQAGMPIREFDIPAALQNYQYTNDEGYSGIVTKQGDNYYLGNLKIIPNNAEVSMSLAEFAHSGKEVLIKGDLKQEKFYEVTDAEKANNNLYKGLVEKAKETILNVTSTEADRDRYVGTLKKDTSGNYYLENYTLVKASTNVVGATNALSNNNKLLLTNPNNYDLNNLLGEKVVVYGNTELIGGLAPNESKTYFIGYKNHVDFYAYVKAGTTIAMSGRGDGDLDAYLFNAKGSCTIPNSRVNLYGYSELFSDYYASSFAHINYNVTLNGVYQFSFHCYGGSKGTITNLNNFRVYETYEEALNPPQALVIDFIHKSLPQGSTQLQGTLTYKNGLYWLNDKIALKDQSNLIQTFYNKGWRQIKVSGDLGERILPNKYLMHTSTQDVIIDGDLSDYVGKEVEIAGESAGVIEFYAKQYPLITLKEIHDPPIERVGSSTKGIPEKIGDNLYAFGEITLTPATETAKGKLADAALNHYEIIIWGHEKPGEVVLIAFSCSAKPTWQLNANKVMTYDENSDVKITLQGNSENALYKTEVYYRLPTFVPFVPKLFDKNASPLMPYITLKGQAVIKRESAF